MICFINFFKTKYKIEKKKKPSRMGLGIKKLV